jgi:hypothetical protein
VSYEADNNDSYYENTHDSYNNFFGALGWRPNHTTAVDFNLEYGHYDWTVNNFQNRVNQELIDDGIYLAGPATPDRPGRLGVLLAGAQLLGRGDGQLDQAHEGDGRKRAHLL